MAGRTVRVRGLPADLPPDRVADKLTIHFLRSRNGGGEIADVQVLPGPRPCALVTFEAPEVARRVLKAEGHVLAFGGKRYPLEVTAYTEELSPDQIFIRACIVVDYDKLPTGKTLLKNLHKGYSNVQLNFDSKNAHCSVKGPFTELQAFSRDLLGSLNLKSQALGEVPLPGSSHVGEETRVPDHQQVPNPAEPAREVAEPPNWDQVHEKAPQAPSPRGPVGGEAVEQLEDFTLAMDLDIYLYMQRFCAAKYQSVLRQHGVDVVDASSDGIAILYLQPSAGLPGSMDTLWQARLALQQLCQQLEVSLRKEKIAKGGLGVDSQALGALTRELQELYPELLCHEDEKQLYLIGNLVDVSQAKQYLQGVASRGGAAHVAGSSQPSHPAASRAAEAELRKPKAPVDTWASGLSPGRGELKLAANFGSLRAGRPEASPALLLQQDSPPSRQAQRSGKHLPEADAAGPSDPAAPAPQDQPHGSTTEAALGSAAESQLKDPKEQGHMKGGARLASPKAPSPSGGREHSSWQYPGDSKGSSPTKHPSLTSMSSTFDVMRTSSALDSQPAKSRPLLRHSNSFSLPRSKESSKPQDTGSRGNWVNEDMSLDSQQWSYLKDVYCFAVDELCGGGGVWISERRTGDCTVLTLWAADRNKLLQAKQKVEALVEKCPDLVCQSMSYSELAVDGPEDSELRELCSLLRGSFPQVGLRRDKYNLYLACPKDTMPAVTEAFREFNARRLRAMKSSSLSPGPESTGHSGVIQPSRSQDTLLGAAPPSSLDALQMGLQDLSISDEADHTEVLRAFWLPKAEEKRSPSPWKLRQARGQEEANEHVDAGAAQGGSSLLSPGVVDKPSLAGLKESQEQLKTKLTVGNPDTARLKQVLPDRFQFVRDKSRGGHNEATGLLRSAVPAIDGGPLSLPTWLYSTMAAELPDAAAQPSPGAEPRGQDRALLPAGRSDVQEEPDLSSRQARSPNLGQESSKAPLGRCDACQGSGVTCQAPCGHALCRTCFAGDRPQAACCSSPSAPVSHRIPGMFKISTLSLSLPGYYEYLTLQVAYSIPDGVQGVGDPHPGQPYKGGDFLAFLPDNKEGQNIAVLLKKAFDRGLTFQIKSQDGEERVTWGLIPHRTSLHGGRSRNGYPDSQYLREVSAVLKKLDIA